MDSSCDALENRAAHGGASEGNLHRWSAACGQAATAEAPPGAIVLHRPLENVEPGSIRVSKREALAAVLASP